MLKTIIKACLSFETRYYTLSQIVKITGLERKAVRHKLWKLESAGLIMRVSFRGEAQ
jgi:predicted AAA+ superfamily ATPase